MCDRETDSLKGQYYKNEVANQAMSNLRTESHLVYELKQKREYHFRKLVEIQQAIDSINKLDF